MLVGGLFVADGRGIGDRGPSQIARQSDDQDGKQSDLQGTSLTAKDAQTWVLSNLPDGAALSGAYQVMLNRSDITDRAGNGLSGAAADAWITGYTANALALGRFGGKPGVRLAGTNANNWLRGTNRRDVLRGLNGNDRLRGFRDRDVLTGGGGNDRLIGNAGDDVLQGGAGKDQLRGGAGRDTFALSRLADKGDRVLDFNASQDLIDLRGIMKAPQYRGENRFAQYYRAVKLTQLGSDTQVQIDLDGQGSGTTMATLMTLQGVTASSVQSTNFVIG